MDGEFLSIHGFIHVLDQTADIAGAVQEPDGFAEADCGDHVKGKVSFEKGLGSQLRCSHHTFGTGSIWG